MEPVRFTGKKLEDNSPPKNTRCYLNMDCLVRRNLNQLLPLGHYKIVPRLYCRTMKIIELI